ncbi:MAG: GNAT family N-acetyltransferase [Sphingopyxis sp.]
MTQSSSGFTLVELGYAELEAVNDVMGRAFDPRFGEAWSKAQCLSLLALPGYRLVGLMSANAQMLGFSISRHVAGESELLLIAVDPASRRASYGTMLMHDWIAHCQNTAISRVMLEVRADNPAIILYEQLGFTRMAVRPAYYLGGDGLRRDAITMHKCLREIESHKIEY